MLHAGNQVCPQLQQEDGLRLASGGAGEGLKATAGARLQCGPKGFIQEMGPNPKISYLQGLSKGDPQ